MVEHLLIMRWVVGSIPHSDPLSCFSVQPVWNEIKLSGKASAYGAMSCWIDPSWWTHSSQCSTTGVTKDVVCAVLSGMVHIHLDGSWKE